MHRYLRSTLPKAARMSTRHVEDLQYLDPYEYVCQKTQLIKTRVPGLGDLAIGYVSEKDDLKKKDVKQ